MQQGQVVGLLGPNGAGKTTSFYMIVGLISPDSGRVLLDETDITELPMYQRARNGISYLPQEASVFRKLSVEQNLMAILETLPINSRSGMIVWISSSISSASSACATTRDTRYPAVSVVESKSLDPL